MTKLDRYVELARAMGVDDAKIIPAKDIFVRDWVFLKCRFGCGGFGERLTCPPRSPSPDQMRRVVSEYKHAVLVHFVRQSGHKSRKGIDFRKITVTQFVADLERRIFLDGYYKAWGMGAGPCELCRTSAKGCRHPRRARPSMEACGIDVYATARKAGFPIVVVTDYVQRMDLYGLILIE